MQNNCKKMFLFDCHCHIHLKGLLKYQNEIKINNEKENIKKIMVCSTNLDDYKTLKSISSDNIFISLGIHPWYCKKDNMLDEISILYQNLVDNPSYSVGEIGLDKSKDIDMSLQQEYFEAQLDLAKDLNRCVSIHCVQCYGTLHDIIKSHLPLKNGILLHSFSGSIDVAKQFINEFNKKDTPVYFSFSSIKKSDKKKEEMKEIIKIIPRNRLLIETDSPDGVFDDMPYKDILENDVILNQPANIITILKEISNILEISEEEVAKITYDNAMRLFGN